MEFTEEIFPLVDENGNVIGSATRSECHSNSKLIHPTVHVHIVNSLNEIFLQKRPMHKDSQPGKWDTAVGGHFSYGESLETALMREISEEVGLTDIKPVLLKQYVWRCPMETEYVYSHILRYDGEIQINTDELDDGKFWSLSEIEQNIGKQVFTPNFENEFQLIKSEIEHN